MSAPLEDYIGLDAETGRAIAGEAHLRQSIRDILTTPIGSEVMARDYGAGLFERVDTPMTLGLTADIVSDSAIAIAAFEPRVRLDRVVVLSASAGALDLDLELTRADRPLAALRLDGVLSGAGA